jgi:hypothetical protein
MHNDNMQLPWISSQFCIYLPAVTSRLTIFEYSDQFRRWPCELRNTVLNIYYHLYHCHVKEKAQITVYDKVLI